MEDEYHPSDVSSVASGGDEEDSDEDYTSLSEGDSSGGRGRWVGPEFNYHVQIMRRKRVRRVGRTGTNWRLRPGKVRCNDLYET